MAGGGEMLDARRGKGRRQGLGWSLIGGRLRQMEGEQERGQDSVAFHTGAGGLPFEATPLPGQRKERGAREGKERGGADGWDLRALREKERALVGG